MKTIEKCISITAGIVRSRWFVPLQAAVAAAAICTGLNMVGCILFVALVFLLLLFSDDILAVLCPVMIAVMTATSYYDNYYEMLEYIWLLIPVAAALIFNIFVYRGKFVKGRFLLPTAAVSVVLLVGGIGTIPVAEYFSGTALYYTLGLGVALLLLYLFISQRIPRIRQYNAVERLAELMYAMAILAALLIICFYVSRWSILSKDFHTPFISYRNFCTTMMLFGLPMSCLFIRRRPIHFVGLVFIYAAMLLGGSRSGLLFGTLELGMCLVYIYINNPEHRKLYRRIAAVCILPVLALGGFLVYTIFLSAGGRFGTHIIKPTEARVSFYPQGVRDFLEKPILGWGLGNMKNGDIYTGVPGSIIFYHNSVLQILASLGLVGGAAYLYQFIVRLRLLRQLRRTDGYVMLLPYIGVLLMSQTNPGLFCPLPTGLLLILMFAVLECCPVGEGSPEAPYEENVPAATS
ncbi:MAG: O-antigen ligase family protein [Ruminococcaceae bacterium]|nr:O-antigen ligase family protein [Oscillospiraceae bacterium]